MLERLFSIRGRQVSCQFFFFNRCHIDYWGRIIRQHAQGYRKQRVSEKGSHETPSRPQSDNLNLAQLRFYFMTEIYPRFQSSGLVPS